MGGCHGAVDITVTHPLQLSEHPLTPEHTLSHTKREEEKKVRSNSDLCQEVGWTCLPFGMHCWAGLGPSGGALLHQIMKRATSAFSGCLKTQKVIEIKQSIVFGLMRQVGRQLDVVSGVKC